MPNVFTPALGYLVLPLKMRNIDSEEQSRLIYRAVGEDKTGIDIGIDLAAYHGVVDVGFAVKFLVVVKWLPAE